MSRTYRKKKSYIPDHITHDLQRVGKPFISNDGKWRMYDWQWVPLEGKELQVSVSKWKRDHHSGECTAPSWYNNLYFERKRRQKTRRELKRILDSESYDDYIFDPYKRCSWYDWW